MIEAYFWKLMGVYRNIDTIICCSDFMKKELSSNPQLKGKLITLHNFIDMPAENVSEVTKGDYVLYFGRYSEEKGIETLIEACKKLPDILFVFAGKGDYADRLCELSNVTDAGFVTGESLAKLSERRAFLSVRQYALKTVRFQLWRVRQREHRLLELIVEEYPN